MAHRAYFLGMMLLLCSAAPARERCAAEAKLLVSPSEVQKSVVALHAERESRGQVYLFDTEGLELYSQGAILRLRTGTKADLTVKLRSEEVTTSQVGDISKCEVDLVGSTALTSLSLSNSWKGQSIPQTGEALHQVLSAAQLRLLAAARISVDWQRIKRIVQIQATAWEVRTEGPLKKVALELWEWPGGKILELSSKSDLQRATSTMGQLRELAAASGLVANTSQQPKTSVVLHAIMDYPGERHEGNTARSIRPGHRFEFISNV